MAKNRIIKIIEHVNYLNDVAQILFLPDVFWQLTTLISLFSFPVRHQRAA